MSTLYRLLFALGLLAMRASALHAQSPFALDPSFRAHFDDWYVSSILPLESGDVIISGQIKFAGDQYFRTAALLNADGSRDLGFAEVPYMGGKLFPWNGMVYSQNGIGVRRSFLDGTLDGSFNMVNAPYFLALQGGDYHVYPDGRVLMSGVHEVNYPDSNWVGFYNLIWFTADGYLDTTRAPIAGDGVIYRFKELPDGKFICTGPMSVYDGQPTSYLFRVEADGHLDPTFYTGVDWGQAFAYYPMSDGRCIVGGMFKINGNPDTLNLVRFLNDGTLDPSFYNNHSFDLAPPITDQFGRGLVGSIVPLDSGRLILTGAFRDVDGEQRNSICVIDTSGNLLDDYFADAYCGPHTYAQFTNAEIVGIHVGDTAAYIWGDYHGYGDGTTNDPEQRFITRLYGPDIGMGTTGQAPKMSGFRLYPNPASTSTTLRVEGTPLPTDLVLRDALGRVLLRQWVTGSPTNVDLSDLATGVYQVELNAGTERLGAERLVVQH